MASNDRDLQDEPLVATSLVSFTAISYFNNRSLRGGTQVFWGVTSEHADAKARAWLGIANNCEVLDEYTGICQLQNLNQQKEYLD